MFALHLMNRSHRSLQNRGPNPLPCPAIFAEPYSSPTVLNERWSEPKLAALISGHVAHRDSGSAGWKGCRVDGTGQRRTLPVVTHLKGLLCNLLLPEEGRSLRSASGVEDQPRGGDARSRIREREGPIDFVIRTPPPSPKRIPLAFCHTEKRWSPRRRHPVHLIANQGVRTVVNRQA